MVDGGAYGFGKSSVIQRRRDGEQFFSNEAVAKLIQGLRRDTGLHMGADVFQYPGCQLTSDPHLLYLRAALDAH
jgi:hypothetical protein